MLDVTAGADTTTDHNHEQLTHKQLTRTITHTHPFPPLSTPHSLTPLTSPSQPPLDHPPAGAEATTDHNPSDYLEDLLLHDKLNRSVPSLQRANDAIDNSGGVGVGVGVGVGSGGGGGSGGGTAKPTLYEVDRLKVSLGAYKVADLYYPIVGNSSSAEAQKEPLPAVIYLHPFSHNSGYSPGHYGFNWGQTPGNRDTTGDPCHYFANRGEWPLSEEHELHPVRLLTCAGHSLRLDPMSTLQGFITLCFDMHGFGQRVYQVRVL
jgi:hypothetical protein